MSRFDREPMEGEERKEGRMRVNEGKSAEEKKKELSDNFVRSSQEEKTSGEMSD